MVFILEISNSYLQAFSDTPDGWAIYNGELRHNSNSTGKEYGTPLKTGDVIGVMLDMIDVWNSCIQKYRGH